jgi:hypothetical protein
MTGVFFHDLYREMPIGHIESYTVRYYLQYPCLSLLIWPPLFPALEGAAMLGMGTSVTAGKLMVASFAALAAVYVYRLVRWTHDDWTAGVAMLLFGFSPMVFSLSRHVMLEVPTLAFAIVAIYYFLHYLKRECQGDLWKTAAASGLAALTRFDAVYLLLYFLMVLTWQRRFTILKRKEVWAAIGVSLAFVIPVYAISAVEVGWGHLRTVQEHNGGAMECRTLLNALYYPSVLPYQVGWFVLSAAMVGLLDCAHHRDLNRTAPHVTMIAATYLAFTALGEREPRHAIYWIPAFTLLAANGVNWAGARTNLPYARAILAAIIITGTAWISANRPAPYVRGYEEAARYVVENTKHSSFCLVDAYLDGNFIYQVRRLDPAGRIWVLRGDKLFYGMLSEPRFGYVEHVRSEDDLLATIHQYDPDLIVVESPRAGPQLALAELLRKTLRDHPDRFRLEKIQDVDSNKPEYQGVHLAIYRNLYRNANREHHLEVDMPWLRRKLGAAVP